jgi:hypothetical protein
MNDTYTHAYAQDALRKTVDGIRKPVSSAVNFYDREIAAIAESFPNAFDVDGHQVCACVCMHTVILLQVGP